MKDEELVCIGGPMDGKKLRVLEGAHDVRVPRMSKFPMFPVEATDEMGRVAFESDLYFVAKLGSKRFLQYEGLSAAEALDCLLEAYGPPESEIEGGVIQLAYMLAKSLLNQMESRYSHMELLGRMRDLDPARFDRATNTTDLVPKSKIAERIKEIKGLGLSSSDAGKAMKSFTEAIEKITLKGTPLRAAWEEGFEKEFGSDFEPKFKLSFPLPPKEGTTTVKGDVGSKSK